MISFVLTVREEAPERLRRTIVELRATSPPRQREILVIDDGSSVPVSGLPADVAVVRNSTAVGVSRARRQGCAIATGDVLVCMDAHMTFRRGWLDRMLAHVDSGALLCSPFWDYEREVCHCFGADFVWCGVRNHARQRSPGFSLRHRLRHPGRGARDVPMAIGACYMVSRSRYDALGGFSPLYRVWGICEQDLSARAWIAGFGVKCVTDAQVGHYSRAAFPYPVSYDDLEFNQIALLRTVFEEQTVAMLEPSFATVSPAVKDWLEQADIAGWRATVQRTRVLSDDDFLRRFVPGLTQSMRASPSHSDIPVVGA